MEYGGEKQAVNAAHHLGVRPYCHCCGGGLKRKNKRYCKSKSRRQTAKARRSKPKQKEWWYHE